MDIRNAELMRSIRVTIYGIGRDFKRNKALILTERDLQCLLYSRLSSLPALAGSLPTADAGISGPRVHAELSWFDEHDRLSIVPDISIITPAELRVLDRRNHYRLPSKRYSFNGPAIIVEAKLCRYRSGITDGFCRREIMKDIQKIKALMTKLSHDGVGDHVHCFFVVFSKFNKRGPLFRQMQRTLTDSRCDLVCCSSIIQGVGSARMSP